MAGRPERPLDPGGGPVQRLAFDLRTLRKEAGGLTYREMAQRAGCSASTLSQAAAGERLPTLTVLRSYVEACGGDFSEWERQWHRAEQERVDDPPADVAAEPPYRGLARFEPGDLGRFFGREAVVARLAAEVGAHRLVAVVGASGCGKSSLLRAGLIPALQAEGSPGPRLAAIRILTPGPRPAAVHADVLVPRPDDGDTVVVVDQFEEVFTLCAAPDERAAFLDRLAAAVEPGSRLRVVIAVRADFFGHCAEHHRLAAALRDATLVVGPMSPAELRDAIVKPAAAAGLTVEKALVTRIVEEASGEPGGLPLMSHALLETWRRRHGRVLTTQMYEAAGGIHKAIAATAEEVYSRLSPPQARAARQILLHLVSPGRDAQDTRRPTRRAELETAAPEAAAVLEQLVRARLLTLDGDTVDIAHEALITAWPRYHGWIDEGRERLRLHLRLGEAARGWDDLDRDPGALYRGTRLAAAEEAFGRGRYAGLTAVERDFLTASVAARDHDTRVAARTARRVRGFAATLAVLLVLALVSGLVAWHQKREAVTAQHAALSRQLAAQSAALTATDPDLAALLAVGAYRSGPTAQATDSLYAAAALPLRRRLTTGVGPVTAVAFGDAGKELAVGGISSGEGGSAIAQGTVVVRDPSTGASRTVFTDRVYLMALSPDGRLLATEDGVGTVWLRDTATGGFRATLDDPRVAPKSMAFSPDGGVLATSDGVGVVRLWDTATGRPLRTLAGHPGGGGLAFAPDGRTLATAAHGTVRLWDTATGRPGTTFDGHVGDITAVALGPGGRTVAVGGDHGTVRLWDTATGRPGATLNGHVGAVSAMAFSPDGRTLATGGNDETVRLWDAAGGGRRATLAGHTGSVSALAFSPDGRSLASGSDDATVRLWDTMAPHPLFGLTGGGGPADVEQVADEARPPTIAFGPDGHTLATLDRDGTLRWWNVATRARIGLTGPSGARGLAFGRGGRTITVSGDGGLLPSWRVATGRAGPTVTGPAVARGAASVLSPDGRVLAVAVDRGILLWDTVDHRSRTLGSDGPPGAMAFSQDGKWLAASDRSATNGSGGTTGLWEVGSGRRVTDLDGACVPVAFSPQDGTLACIESDDAIHLWDVTTGQSLGLLHANSATVTAAAFSPDGRALATTGDDGVVRLWDVGSGAQRVSFSADTKDLVSVAISPDGRTLATGDGRGGAQLWGVVFPDTREAVDDICRAVGHDLTARERARYLPGRSGPVCPAGEGG